MTAIGEMARTHPDVEVVYPVHLSPVVRECAQKYLAGKERIHLIDPVDVEEMHNLLARCYLVLTDSGGLRGGGARAGQACTGDAEGDGAARGRGRRYGQVGRRHL